MHRGRNLLRKPVLIQCDVNRWTSTAFRCAESNALLTRPGRSLPCSWFSGLSSSNTLSVLRFGNFSSPSLRRNKALRPSPTNTNAPCGILSLVICYSQGSVGRPPKAAGTPPPPPPRFEPESLRLFSTCLEANRGLLLLVDPGQPE